MNLEKLIHRSRALGIAAALTGLCLAALAFAAPGEDQPGEKPLTSDQRFKNVQVLKDIPISEFMGTMGVMTGSLGFDCSDCHTGAGTDQVDWAYDTPRKATARRMVKMVANINHDNFGGRQVVTCYSCHHGRDRPLTTPTVESVYSTPPMDMDDVLAQEPTQPAADQIIDRYIKALGGAEALASVKSFVATGTSIGFGGLGGGAQVKMYAKAPDQRALIIDFKDAPGRGDTLRIYDGHRAWFRTPMNILGEYEVSGGELDGARFDAMMSFPGQIKQLLTKLRVSLPQTISDLPAPSSQSSKEDNTGIGQDRLVDVVQGNGPRDLLVTLYFDHDTGLLLRIIRYSKSVIGRFPTQIDLADYRDVGGGVKMPFRMTFAWLNGRDAIRLNGVKLNTPVDPAVFGKPAPNTVSSK
ncbi:MAG TPA: photosynthetic reaction center cytochrome c subunit family protein [Bryobacteraceae bacterium]|nr:photosynthetic reaction center cytochrome c subunit family protein [Bryobacteraceae bacterium]